jgi:Gram-negative bacterial TonB protein C-terminal
MTSQNKKLFCLNIAIFGATFAMHCPNSIADEKKSVYIFKDEYANISSLNHQTILSNQKIPLNKRYKEFNLEEKTALKSAYDLEFADDEPPFPEDGLRPLLTNISKAEECMQITGDLLLIADVNAAGKVTSVSVTKSPTPKFAKLVAQFLYITKFKPALCEGKPCDMQYPLALKFVGN